jgi:hypothetical protein
MRPIPSFGSYLARLIVWLVKGDELGREELFIFQIVLKYLLFVHVSIALILSLYLLPHSLFIAPIFTIILGTAVFSFKTENQMALLPLQWYLVSVIKFSNPTNPSVYLLPTHNYRLRRLPSNGLLLQTRDSRAFWLS